jgi:hypothetical protein
LQVRQQRDPAAFFLAGFFGAAFFAAFFAAMVLTSCVN